MKNYQDHPRTTVMEAQGIRQRGHKVEPFMWEVKTIGVPNTWSRITKSDNMSV